MKVNDADPHPSLAVGLENSGVSGQKIVSLAPTLLIAGGVRSLIHVTVLETLTELPQPSLATNVLVCDRLHVPVTRPSEDVITGVPHSAVAVALPSAVLISPGDGLHASVTLS